MKAIAAGEVKRMFLKLRSAYCLFWQVRWWSYYRYDRKILLYKKTRIKLHKTCRLQIPDKALVRMGSPWDPLELDFSLYSGGVDCYNPVFFDTHFVAGRNTYIELADRFNLCTGCLVRVQQNGQLIIGENFFLNSFSTIFCYEKVQIGNDVLIGHYTQIRDSGNHTVHYPGARKNTAPVIIEDHVWIASHVTIHKGVTIGTGSVIASGSIVTSDVPPRCLVGGIPAKVLRENISWEK